MKKLLNIALTSEFSFKRTFAHINELVASQKEDVVGVADFDNTFAHYKLSKECKKLGKKPIFGVRLMVVRSPEEHVPPRGQYGPIYIVIAKNYEGLKEIYGLVRRATECFYYRAHVGLIDIWGLSENVIVIAENFDIAERIDYIGISFRTPEHIRRRTDIPHVALQASKYISPEDREVFELFVDDNGTYPGHILSTEEWMAYFKDEEAVNNTHVIAEQCNVEFKKAKPVKYLGEGTLEELCEAGARRLGIDIFNDGVYKERYEREISLIDKKQFRDYFMIVAEMINKAKKEMFVGPSRGSAAGSLVCYLTGITEIDPIKWNLLFDRFIDINRNDMPDIDTDFPDKKRDSVIQELIRRNGESRVKHIATISEIKFKSALGIVAKGLGVPQWEVEEVSASVAKHSSGDIRHATQKGSVELALTETDIGREFIKRHPKMILAARLEEHASHTGVHAAGMMVSAEDLTDFAGINARDDTFMMDHKDAEEAGLLKMDCLGLTTLSVLEDLCHMIGINDPSAHFLSLPLDDDNVFNVFREGRLSGIFQYEGYALQNLCRGIKVREFEDIVAITALARPGPLHGGAAKMFSEIHQGKREIDWVIDHEIAHKITRKTLGTIVYQEQLMEICREIGNMDWEQVNEIRRGASKKKGKEYFNKFREIFISGAKTHGIEEEKAAEAWESMLTFGAYGFNRSHAVAYGMISYWTAWAKCYHPLEFAAASLNNAGGVDSSIKLLRELKEKEGIEYIPVDPDNSMVEWTIKDGKLLGGLTNIKGIGVASAKKIIKCREEGKMPPANLIKKLVNPQTEFDILFPTQHYWGELYSAPTLYGLDTAPSKIKAIKNKGTYVFIGRLIKKNDRDLNELVNVQKRGGEVLEEYTHELNLTFEDDTDVMMCRIGRKQYDKMAPEIIEHGREGVDYYLVKGDIIADDIRFIFIREIYRLGDGIEETIYDL